MNVKMIGRYLAYLLWCEAFFIIPSAIVAIIYKERTSLTAFVLSMAICLSLGLALFLACRKSSGRLYAREAFVVAGGGWLLLSLFGALPFYISGEIPDFANALFESISGFTSTGASVLSDVEALGKSMLFWRSFTLWLGGIGVLAFLLTLVRNRRGTGFSLHLLRAETPGPQVGKMLPKMRDSVRMLYLVYGGLSLINLIVLLAAKMPLFDALCTMFGTAGTGGFAIRNDGLLSYTPFAQTATGIFMVVFGVNFALYYAIVTRRWKTVLKDEELRLYFGILIISSLLIAINIVPIFKTFGTSLYHAGFTVASIMSSTGFTIENFGLWPQFSQVVLLLLMLFGAMAGSTGGGLKISRLLILLKSFRVEFGRLLHPRSVKVVRVNGKAIDDSVVRGVYFFLCFYAFIALLIFLIISMDNLPMETNISATLAYFNNIGPGLGMVGPVDNFSAYSSLSKMVLSASMLLGRLEIFPIFLLFHPDTWRKKS